MKLIFAVLDVSLTMGLTRCYKTKGFLHLFLRKAEMIRKNFDVTSATYGSYGCSVTNRTRFYFSRAVTYGSTLRYGFLRYVTLREGGKHA